MTDDRNSSRFFLFGFCQYLPLLHSFEDQYHQGSFPLSKDGVDSDCLGLQSVAQICAVLPRTSYFFASPCLVKKLEGQVSEVS